MNDVEFVSFAAKAFGSSPDNFSPLTDDCHAFRLAVKLNLTIVFHPTLNQSLVRQYHDKEREWVENGENHDDPYAATRRAIVRAAAEIGRNMP